MKNILLVIAITWAGITTVNCQSIWNRIPLTGSEAKIIPAARQPRFSIGFSTTIPLGDVALQSAQLTRLQEAAFVPEVMGQLFEKLGGEFFIGSLTGETEQSINMDGQTCIIPGIELGVRFGKRFDLRAGVGHFRSEWSGQFPVTVFPHSEEILLPPKTEQGSITASTSGILAYAETAFYLTGGRVRTYVSGGVRGQFSTHSNSGASIAGVQLPFTIEQSDPAFTLFAGAGARWNFWNNAFLGAGCTFGQWPGNTFSPALHAGAGWTF